MNEQIKQRLVGAVVLTSLAVIFIPMLLDGGDEGGMPMFGSNIPKKPDYKFEPLDIPLDPVEPISQEKPRLIDKPEPVAKKPKPQATPAAPATPKPAQPKEPALVVKAAPPPAPVKVDKAWAVQVGSFSSSANALKLRDKLKAKGYSAFVEKMMSNSKPVYRVRVGPELSREKADLLKEKLQENMRLKGIVLGYTP